MCRVEAHKAGAFIAPSGPTSGRPTMSAMSYSGCDRRGDRGAQLSAWCGSAARCGGTKPTRALRSVFMSGPVAEELNMCGWGPYAREASVWEACCWHSGVLNKP